MSRFGEVKDVWTHLENDSTAAMNLRVRSALMRALNREIKTWEGTRETHSQRLNTTTLRLKDLAEGNIDKFTIDALVILCIKAELKIEFHIKGIDV